MRCMLQSVLCILKAIPLIYLSMDEEAGLFKRPC